MPVETVKAPVVKIPLMDKIRNGVAHVVARGITRDDTAGADRVKQAFSDPAALAFWANLPKLFEDRVASYGKPGKAPVGSDAIKAFGGRAHIKDGSKLPGTSDSYVGAWAQVKEALGDDFVVNAREINLLTNFLTASKEVIAARPENQVGFATFAKALSAAFPGDARVSSAIDSVNTAFRYKAGMTLASSRDESSFQPR